jgi:hypothetical protein
MRLSEKEGEEMDKIKRVLKVELLKRVRYLE